MTDNAHADVDDRSLREVLAPRRSARALGPARRAPTARCARYRATLHADGPARSYASRARRAGRLEACRPDERRAARPVLAAARRTAAVPGCGATAAGPSHGGSTGATRSTCLGGPLAARVARLRGGQLRARRSIDASRSAGAARRSMERCVSRSKARAYRARKRSPRRLADGADEVELRRPARRASSTRITRLRPAHDARAGAVPERVIARPQDQADAGRVHERELAAGRARADRRGAASSAEQPLVRLGRRRPTSSSPESASTTCGRTVLASDPSPSIRSVVLPGGRVRQPSCQQSDRSAARVCFATG